MPATIRARKIGPPMAASDAPSASNQLIDAFWARSIHQKTPAMIA